VDIGCVCNGGGRAARRDIFGIKRGRSNKVGRLGSETRTATKIPIFTPERPVISAAFKHVLRPAPHSMKEIKRKENTPATLCQHPFRDIFSKQLQTSRQRARACTEFYIRWRDHGRDRRM
jgi:hypothetical protein